MVTTMVDDYIFSIELNLKKNIQSNISWWNFFHSKFSCFQFFPLGLDQRMSGGPLFEAQLDLRVPDMVFTPPLEVGAGDSFFELVESLTNDVFRISSLVPRLAEHSPVPNYQVPSSRVAPTLRTWTAFHWQYLQCRSLPSTCHMSPQADMEQMAALVDMRHLLMQRVQSVMEACCKFRSSLECYSYLYMEDRREFMRQFLLYGQVLGSQEAEGFPEDGVSENLPTLDNFREQVDRWVLWSMCMFVCFIKCTWDFYCLPSKGSKNLLLLTDCEETTELTQ